MSFPSTTARVAYSGDGSTVEFSVTFPFQANADLAVVLTTAGVDTTQTLNTHYVVGGAGQDSGGTVRFTTAPASGTTVTIFRDVDLNQERSFTYNGAFPTTTVTLAVDKAMQAAQQLNEKLKRTFRIAETNAEIAPLTVAHRAGKIPGFDSSGAPALYEPEIAVLPNGAAYDVATIAALKSIPVGSIASNKQIVVAGYYSPGDGGGGVFYYDGNSSASDNGGTVIAPSVGSGRWLRSESSEIDAAVFGITDDNLTDFATALQSAINACSKLVIFKRNTGIIKIGSQISLKSNFELFIGSGVTIKANADMGVFTFVNSNASTGNENIRICGNGTIDCANALRAIALTKCSNTVLADFTCIGPIDSGEPVFAGGIDLRECTNTFVVNVKSTKKGGCGLLAEKGHSITVLGGAYYGCIGDSGVDITECPKSKVIGVTAYNNAASGITVSSQDSIVSGCTVYGNQWGINIAHDAIAWSGSNCTVSGNISINNTSAGVVVQGSHTTNVTLFSNTVHSNPTNYNIGAGTLAVNSSISYFGAGTALPELALHVAGESGAPETSGTSQTGVARFQGSGSNAVLDFSINGGDGASLQATNKADLSAIYPIAINPNGGGVKLGGPTYPSTTLGGLQTDAPLFAGAGVPANGIAPNGAFYLRSDGGSGTSIYHRRSNVWVGIV